MNPSNLVAALALAGGLAACDDGNRRASPDASTAPAPARSAVASASGSASAAPRSDEPAAARDLAAWRERLPLHASDAACAAQLKTLARQDPALLVVVASVRRRLGEFDDSCTSRAHVAGALRSDAGAETLLELLRHPAAWRFGATLPWKDAARDLIAHSDHLFFRRNTADLLVLLRSPQFDDDGLRSGLLAAVPRDASARRDLYREWAPRLQRPDPRFAREYLREFPLELVPPSWYEKVDDACREELARAVFESVRTDDPTAAPVLLRLVKEHEAAWQARPIVFGFLVDAVARLGAPKRPLACRKELPDRCTMTSVDAAARTSRAVATCVTAARAWLETRARSPSR
ncbi:MAG TPA: hypothetical protein VGK73_08430 [Polyangiaceae bacterium]